MIDTGPEFRVQCLREGIAHLDAAVYTHAHMDHVVGFDDLRRFCDVEGFFLPVYATPLTLEHLKRMFVFAFEGKSHTPGYIRPDPREIHGPFLIGDTLLTPLPLPHGRFICNGYLFTRHHRKIAAYLSDCNAVPVEVREQIQDVETLVIDGLRYRPHPTHLSVSEAIEVARSVNAGATYLTHISHDLDHEIAGSALPSGVYLAYDGLRLDL